HTTKRCERTPVSARGIAKIGHVDGSAMRIVAVDVEAPITFEQRMMRPGGVTAINANFLPVLLAGYIAVIEIVVGHHTARPGLPHYDDLVDKIGDAVLNQILAGGGVDVDRVARATRHRPNCVVRPDPLKLHAEGLDQHESAVQPQLAFDVFGP